ncbi:MAG: RagB/SusD family nutrient uptake outer membrane protein [Prevotellaceae bacterium]|jgi:hypothetical protein|nr:RagB/SusD family nutrient uptake outer membrane protein [Prevotellaceae bacterium]
MKKYIAYISCALLMATFVGCDDFLDRDPLNKETNDSYWASESSLRTYAQDFYSYFFTGYGTDYTAFGGFFSGDNFTDDFQTRAGGQFAFPLSATTDINSTITPWTNNYQVVYKANVMIEKIPDMNVTDEVKNHWMGVARFFRAMGHSALLKTYGAVPYFEAVTDPADAETLYKDRDPYLTVAKSVLADFQYALQNVRTDDTKRQVNRYWVGALMSREMLYHATWLKYQGTTVGSGSQSVAEADLKELFQGAIDGATLVMNSGLYAIGNNYNGIFSSDDLAGNREVIIYREYTTGVQCNSLMSYNAGETHTMGDVTQDVINSYLCSDGLPIGQSPLYKGATDPSVANSFIDRDPRLYQTVVDTLRIMNSGIATAQSYTGYCTKKFLNEDWWSQNLDFCKNINSPADAPQVRYAEVLLNYVEARYEISKIGGSAFAQADLDQTINLLRGRKLTKWGETPQVERTMPGVTLAGSNLSVNGTVINDPARDNTVDPILWEIRRERRTELVMEGRRGEDLKRWAKYEYLNVNNADGTPTMAIVGAYIKKSDYPGIKDDVKLFNPNDPSNTAATEGYIYDPNLNGKRAFTKGDINSERYYLRALPAAQLTIYKDKGYTLTQNPGWE